MSLTLPRFTCPNTVDTQGVSSFLSDGELLEDWVLPPFQVLFVFLASCLTSRVSVQELEVNENKAGSAVHRASVCPSHPQGKAGTLLSTWLWALALSGADRGLASLWAAGDGSRFLPQCSG